MNINFSYKADPTPTDIVRVIAYKASDPGTEVVRVEFDPPHVNPRDVSLSVPSPVVHIVKIFETPDSISVGVLKAEYVATPSFDGPLVVPPLKIKVGRGISDRDPVDDSTGVSIPSIAGNKLSWVEQRGAGPLTGPNDDPDPDAWEYEVRPTGGIDLVNGKRFYDGEEYWLYFEPVLDGNVSAAIQDLTDLLETHINDKENPHEVTRGQVGLGNLPNAISNSYQLDDEGTLATSKAVHDLWLLGNSVIRRVSRFNCGAIPPNTDRLFTITHNLALPNENYVVSGNLHGYTSNFNDDNDCSFTTKNNAPNSFQLAVRNFGGATAQLTFDYIIAEILED